MAKKALLGEKLGMTQVWQDNVAVPVTVVRVRPCRVVQVKTATGKDGYNAIQITVGEAKEKHLTKGELGHFKKAAVAPGRKLVELRLDEAPALEVGSELEAQLFEAGEHVDVSGVSKGKGFAGAMKRHGFSGQPASHGAHRVHRKPGSVGQCATPSRVFKGKRMAGRMGAEKVTTLNLEIMRVDADSGLLLIRGAVPGPRGGTLIIRNAVKKSQEGAA